MSKRAEILSAVYADERLNVANPELAISAYARHTKMKIHVFDGNDLEAAFEDGYEQAEKDIIFLIESRIGEILGDAQPAPVLRAELRELIKQIKEEKI